MSEFQRPQPAIPESPVAAEQRRQQVSLNLAELAVLFLVHPPEALRLLEQQTTALAIDPKLELEYIKEDELDRSV